MPEQQDDLKKDIATVLLGFTRCNTALQMARGEVLTPATMEKVNEALMTSIRAIDRLTKIHKHVKGCSHGCV